MKTTSFRTRLLTGLAGLAVAVGGVTALAQNLGQDNGPRTTGSSGLLLRPGQTITGSGGNLPAADSSTPTGQGGSGGCAQPLLLGGRVPLCPGQSVTGFGGNVPRVAGH